MKKIATMLYQKHSISDSFIWIMRGILIILLIFVFKSANAQSLITVKGKVTDASDNTPLPGVNIVVKGTTHGTATNNRGEYSLSQVNQSDTLIFSFIGYVPKTVFVNGRSTINVALEAQAIKGQEMVVIGYGEEKKSDITGAMSDIQVDSLAKGVTSTIDNLLNGSAPGVQVVQNSAAPGGGVSISIRGASSINAGTGPLYVIDGLPVSSGALITGTGNSYPSLRAQNNILSSINPSDIKSISILKGPSATAIYGARGSNGVILITTKQGKKGPMRISYNSYAGIQNVAHQLNVLNAQQYKSVLNGIIADGGGDPTQKVTTIANNGKGTNWQQALFNKNAMVQNQELSFSGGNSTTNYFVSLNYLNQDGVIINNSNKRYGARLNLNTHLSDKFNLGINLSSTYDYLNSIPTQSFGVNYDNGVLYDAYNYDPTLTIKNSDGTYTTTPYITTDNPVAAANGKSSHTNTYRTFGNVFGVYNILPQLSVKVNIGGDILNQRKNVYVSTITKKGLQENGVGTLFYGTRSNYLFEGTVHYIKTFNNQNLDILAGATAQKFSDFNANESANNFPSEAVQSYNLGLGDPTNFTVYDNKQGNSILSYIGRVKYSLKNTYLLTGSMRIDGSSRFGTNNKFGYFPSFALAWRLTNENFMKKIRAINQFKIRFSWGQTGNDEIGNYAAIPAYSTGRSEVIDGNLVTTTEPTGLANPNLKWETSQETDIGVDFGFFNNRISGTFDYYYKKTFDMLVNLPLPTSTGFTTKLSNVGSMMNKGIDFSLQTRNFSSSVFSWNSNINLSTVTNKVLNLGGIQSIINGGAGFSGTIFMTEPGLPLRSYYGYKIIGVWQTSQATEAAKYNAVPGDLRYADINNDGTINASDRVILGNSFPKFSWTFGNTFLYKNFSLNVLFMGVQGISMFNDNLVDTYFPINFRRNKMATPYLNRWTTTNPSNKYPSFVTPLDQGEKAVNSYTVENASYLRLQSVRISYSLPHIINAIRSATIYVTGENLFTITKYDGVDPAINSNGSANTRIDYNTYPSARTFLLGLKLGL